jgi:hypothetical protein
MAETLSIDDQIKQVDLELKQTEAIAKKRELEEQGRRVWTVMRNPAVIAGGIAAIATLCTAIFGWITSSIQAHAEHRNFQQQLNANIILKILEVTAYHNPQSPNSPVFNYGDTLGEMRLLFDAGLLTDDTGALKKLFEPPPRKAEPVR